MLVIKVGTISSFSNIPTFACEERLIAFLEISKR
jgi:hypothetical protein